ncbi:MAG: hypothetical protein AAF602_00135 [Myxococcota bacterium]
MLRLVFLMVSCLFVGTGCAPDDVANSPTLDPDRAGGKATRQRVKIGAALLVRRHLLEQPGIEGRRAALADIVRLPGVASAELTPDDNNIWLEHADGQASFILAGEPGTRGGPTTGTTLEPSAFATLPQKAVGGQRVLVWMPFASQFAHVEGDDIATMFASSECPTFEVDVVMDGEADLASVLRFTEYETVILVTHGAVAPDGEVYFLTREWDDETGEAPSAPELLDAGRGIDAMVGPSFVPLSELPTYEEVLEALQNDATPQPWDGGDTADGYYVVGASAIGGLPGRFEDGSVVYNGSCSSAYNDTLAQAFFDKGAGAYLGYDLPVSDQFAESHGLAFFESLIYGVDRVGDAFQRALDNQFPYDLVGAPAQFRLLGDPDLVYPCVVGARLSVDGPLPIGSEPWLAPWNTPAESRLWRFDPSLDGLGTTEGCPSPGSWGTPLASDPIPPDAWVMRAHRLQEPLLQQFTTENIDVSEPGCTSFVAASELGTERERVLVTASQHEVWANGERDVEFQIRYDSDRGSCLVGETELNPPIEDRRFVVLQEAACDVELVYGPPTGNRDDRPPYGVPPGEDDPGDEPGGTLDCTDVGPTTLVVETDAELAPFAGVLCIRGNLVVDDDVTDLSPLDALEVVEGGLFVRTTAVNPAATVPLSALREVESLEILGNFQWTGPVTLPALERITTGTLTLGGTMSELRFPMLVEVGGGVSIRPSPDLTVLSFPVLETVGSTFRAEFVTGVRELSLPALDTLSGDLVLSYVGLQNGIDLPRLTTLGTFAIDHVSAPTLDGFAPVTLTGDLSISTNLPLVDITALNSLTSVGGDLSIVWNSNLPTVQADDLVTRLQGLGFTGSIDVQGND